MIMDISKQVFIINQLLNLIFYHIYLNIPRYIHHNIIKGALYRAVRLCSNVKDFDRERLYIELTLLLNGYPLKFVTCHFKKFFEKYNVISLLQTLDNSIYQVLHKQLLAQLSHREKQYQESLQVQQNQTNNFSKPTTISIHFTFESGPMLKFKQELRYLWQKYYIYKGSPMNNVHLQVVTRSNKSLCQLLVKKKPPKRMLVNM